MDGRNFTDSPKGCRGPTSGFTLLEAAIIIVIVVIVAAILFPVFVRPHHGGARKSSCQSNMKELGTSLFMYLGDYDNKMPSSYLYGRSKTWNRSDFTHFASVRGELPPPDDAKVHFTWPMLFYPYMKNKDIIWCPSDPNYESDQENATVSYFYKAAVDRAWYGDGKKLGVKEGDFDYPADQVIFYEHNSWHWGEVSRGLSDGVTLNMTFLDGHVQARRIVNSGGPDVTPAPAVGEPAWFNCTIDKTGREVQRTGRLWDIHHCYDKLP